MATKDQRRPREEAPQSKPVGEAQANEDIVGAQAAALNDGNHPVEAHVPTIRAFLGLLFRGVAEGEDGDLPPDKALAPKFGSPVNRPTTQTFFEPPGPRSTVTPTPAAKKLPGGPVATSTNMRAPAGSYFARKQFGLTVVITVERSNVDVGEMRNPVT